ncbi:MAG: hypothetical protein PHR20_00290 [Bacteroidales bacterium]|nr:hypothetical protein [Bacteroidales bacterium]
MKILIAPMAAVAETSGPFSRAAKLALECLKRGYEVAFCAAEDVNYKPIDGVSNFYAPVPSPLGLPMCLGKRMFRYAQKLGIQQRKTVHSYEEALNLVGAVSKRHFPKDVEAVREAIRHFNPDVVYAEFRIAAIVAARLENKPVITGFSYPVQTSYASSPQYSRYVRKYLKANNLPDVTSSLEIFDWADLKIVPSSYDLEPIKGENVVFTGPFVSSVVAERYNCADNAEKGITATIGEHEPVKAKDGQDRLKNTFGDKNKIVVYMGNGTITARRQLRKLTKAFSGTHYEIYLASQQLKEEIIGNIHVAHRFDFRKLFPETVAFINHGGQNSVMDGLLNGVPQIICPGRVFERKYNAASVERLKAGVVLTERDFSAVILREIIKYFCEDRTFSENACNAGRSLMALGGVGTAVDVIEKLKFLH